MLRIASKRAFIPVIIVLLAYLIVSIVMLRNTYMGETMYVENVNNTRNIYNYYNDNESIICNVLFPDRVCYFPHHKTGVKITKQIFMWIIFDWYCKFTNINLTMHSIKFLRCVDNKKSITTENNLSKNTNMRKLSMLNITNKHTATFFHMTRDPVATIISGYYYHLKCFEPFINIKYSNKNINLMDSFFGAVYKNTTIIKNIYENMSYPNLKLTTKQAKILKSIPIKHPKIIIDPWLYPRFVFFYGAMAIVFRYSINDWRNSHFYGLKNFIKNNIIIDECETKYNPMKNINVYDLSFKEILLKTKKDNSLKCGLYLEMLRYLFITFIEQFEYYNLLNIKNKNRINHYELKMENFINNFDMNVNLILDGLNIKDTKLNNEKLSRYVNAKYINISFEREVLFNKIKMTADPRLPDNAKSHHVHIHRNNTMAVNILLNANNGSICILLKYITPLIGYKWKYEQYC
eukprot:487052_1